MAAVIFMIGFWAITGSLEDVATVFAGAVFLLMMGGIALLARTGRVTLAAWILVTLLLLLLFLDLLDYGIGTTTAAMAVIPILLAACCLGWWQTLVVTGIGIAMMWGLAWAFTSGRLVVEGATDISQLTFNAPALTVLLALVALIAGTWIDTLTKALLKKG
jgi:hypothetical protein